MIKNVLIDLDDTIFDFHKAEAIGISKTLEQIGIEPSEKNIKRYSEINDSQWKLLEKGVLTREQVLTRRFSLLFEELGVACDPMETRNIYETYLSKGHFLIDGAEDMLKELSKNYNLYLVSNGTAKVQHGRLDSSDIQKYFKEIFISQEIGYNKPDVRFFEECFKKIGNIKRDETIIVGDSLSSDIQGGINAGIHTCWFNPKNQENNTLIKPEMTVRKLGEISQVIK